MAFIAIIGCDGTGKSSVITHLVDHYSGRGIRCHTGHWRPSQDRVRRLSMAGQNPHHTAPRNTIGSLVKVVFLWCAWWGAWPSLRKQRGNSGLLIYDRYHADLLIDPIRYRYGGPMWFAHLMVGLMPRPDLVLILDAPARDIAERKQELPLETLELLRERYLRHAGNIPNAHVIDASQPLQCVVSAACRHIDRLMVQA
jgi:thymidylate kinase